MRSKALFPFLATVKKSLREWVMRPELCLMRISIADSVKKFDFRIQE
jgi:hypothetical protein